MEQIRGEVRDNRIVIWVSGRIDSSNAGDAEDAFLGIVREHRGEPVTLDGTDLEYMSSAGLRLILKLLKTNPNVRIVNVTPDIYDILEMTGFTEMMPVERAYKTVSIEGAELIGKGAKGSVYRIDGDNIVKVYNNPEAVEDIKNEREVARKALILGIPTAISYDIVKVGDSYGSVFEMLNATTFARILADEPEKFDWCVKEYTDLLKQIHGTLVPEGELPDMKDEALAWVDYSKDYLPEEVGQKLRSLVEAVPHNNHMIHGDYHPKNLEMTGDEVLLIDMDTLSVGDPIFEFVAIYNALIGFHEINHEGIKEFQGFDFETGQKFWRRVLAEYLETTDEERIKEVEDKVRLLAYTRLMRWGIRQGGLEDEVLKVEIEHWKGELLDLVDGIDSVQLA